MLFLFLCLEMLASLGRRDDIGLLVLWLGLDCLVVRRSRLVPLGGGGGGGGLWRGGWPSCWMSHTKAGVVESTLC